MVGLRTCLIGFSVLALFQATVGGSSIQVDVSGFVDGHLVNQTVTLSDPSQPLSISLPSTQLQASSGPNGYYGSGSLDSSFSIYVSVSTPGSPSQLESPAVEVSGTIQGSYEVASYMVSDINGSLSGVGTTAGLTPNPDGSLSSVPSYLSDLLNHPERVGVYGSVTGGYQNILQVGLGIGPPIDPNAEIPAPEPSMLAIALMALASLPIARRWRRRRD